MQKSKDFTSQNISSSFAASSSAFDNMSDSILAIRDIDTGIEYYMDIFDTFLFEGHIYCAMSYLDSSFKQHEENIVIMRKIEDETSKSGYSFLSISDPQELEAVFECFFLRYEQSNMLNNDN